MSTLGIILIILLILVLVGGLPSAPMGYNRGGGWGMPGVVLIILIIVVVLLLTGRINI